MKATITSIVIAIVLIGGALIFSGGNDGTGSAPNANNVSIVNGKQIVELRAKGGYQPRKNVAKAGIPTVLRFNTSGTFDCSAAVRIPSMNISKLLPQTGMTDIDLGSPQPGTLKGMCGMGMYPFEVMFIL